MRSFFRYFSILVLVGTAFAGGWISSAMLNQDPILAKTFNLYPSLYDQLIQDIVAAVEDSRLAAKLTAMEEALAASRNVPDGAKAEISPESDVLRLPEDRLGLQQETGGQFTGPEAGVLVIDPGKLGQQVYERMPNREKMAFFLWLRSKFDEQELQDLEKLISQGLTTENLAEIYRRLRQNLTEKDFEYLLAIVDKYLIDNPSSQPYVEARERGPGGSIPY